MNDLTLRYLPTDDAQRLVLHNEIHTRPSATFGLPALLVYVAVLNSEVSVADEFAHLQYLSMDLLVRRISYCVEAFSERQSGVLQSLHTQVEIPSFPLIRKELLVSYHLLIEL